MFKKMMLLGLLLIVFVVNLLAGGLSESERQEIAERGRKQFIASLDNIIEHNEQIESELESDQSQINAFNGDTRQILIFYKYMIYGDKITQKKGIDGFNNWYGNPDKAMEIFFAILTYQKRNEIKTFRVGQFRPIFLPGKGMGYFRKGDESIFQHCPGHGRNPEWIPLSGFVHGQSLI